MNTIIITGKVDSEVKVINTDYGAPLCRFTLLADDRKFNCIVAGKKAFQLLYEVKLGARITIDSIINNRNQLVVQRYEIISAPNNFGYVFDYKGRQMPHKKGMF